MKKILVTCALSLMAVSAMAESQQQTAQPSPLTQEQQLAASYFVNSIKLERTTPLSSMSQVVVFRVSEDTVCKVKVRHQKLKAAATGEAPQVQLVIDGKVQCLPEHKKETVQPVKRQK